MRVSLPNIFIRLYILYPEFKIKFAQKLMSFINENKSISNFISSSFPSLNTGSEFPPVDGGALNLSGTEPRPLPHTNAGPLSREEMAELADVNASMGLPGAWGGTAQCPC